MSQNLARLLLALPLVCECGIASANIVYTVNFPPTPATEVVTGTITTDGATGSLTAPDITAFDLTVAGALANFTLDSAVAGTKLTCSLFGGCGLTATVTTLDLDVSSGFDPLAVFADAAGDAVSLGPSGGPDVEINFDLPNAGSVLDWFTPSPMQIGTVSGTSAVPEPGTLALLGLGLAGLGFSRHKRSLIVLRDSDRPSPLASMTASDRGRVKTL